MTFLGQMEDDRTRFAGLCEFEALAGDFDEDDGLWDALYEHINGGRRYRHGFRRHDVCRRCGCTPNRACSTSLGMCRWVWTNLCSACDEQPGRRRFRRSRLGPEQAARLRGQWRRWRELHGLR